MRKNQESTSFEARETYLSYFKQFIAWDKTDYLISYLTR